MKSNFSISKEKLNKNCEIIQDFMQSNNLDSFYISSFDTFLSEYVPLEECHRYYFTGFTGSVADILIPTKGRVLLFVDGRYHEQADKEVDPDLVEVVKCPYGKSLWQALLEEAAKRGFKNIGIEGDRTPLTYKIDLEKNLSVRAFNNGEVSTLVNFSKFKKDLSLETVSLKHAGKSTQEKLDLILNDDEALFVTALDSIAWLSNLRGYQLPYQSTFMAKAFATKNHLFLFVNQEVSFESPEGISVHFAENFNLNEVLGKAVDKLNIKTIMLEKALVNTSDFDVLNSTFSGISIEELAGGLTTFHAHKNESELTTIKESFKVGDKAIYESVNWLKNKISNKEEVSELDFYNSTNDIYKKSGARDLSFKTISAVGANSSFVHFSSPSAETKAKEGDMVLLDSGGFFDGGYATDTTRTFFLGAKPSKKHKEIYTLVLKGLLQCQNAIFPEGTWGSAIDSLARFSMRAYGYDYAHGTGHGVGINVHEGNFRLSPTSQTPLLENHIGSIEPGIYLPGFGGVRLENIVVVKKHPKHSGMLMFEPLVYIGFEEILIERSLLTDQEIEWLDEYEEVCKSRSTSFRV